MVPSRKALAWLLLGLCPAPALARPVAIGGVLQAPAVASRELAAGEALAVWTLPRLGVSVRNDPNDLRLLYGSRELRYRPGSGWQALGFSLRETLFKPEILSGSLYVPLAAVRQLGVRVSADAPDVIDFAAPAIVPTTTLPPSSTSGPGAVSQSSPTRPPSRGQPSPGQVSPSIPSTVPPRPQGPAVAPSTAGKSAANLNTVRISRTLQRGLEVQRVVFELSAPASYAVTREKAGLSLSLAGVSGSASEQRLPSGDLLSLQVGVQGMDIHLTTGGGTSEIFTLEDPPRVVVDTTTVLDSSVPPPIDPDSLPGGVTYRNRGYLHLLSFDPALYQARVVSAPTGQALDIAALVKSVGGVGGVNGGYFDPASRLPVDLVVTGGLMTAPSLERRATVGFTANGQTLMGYPRPRYTLSGPFGTVLVNTVGAKPRPELLSAFVGDGRTAVGAGNLLTLYVSLSGRSVLKALSGPVVPPAGTLALTFDPARFPQLPREAGQPLETSLAWRAEGSPWDGVQDALSAGPLLVRGGQVAVDPQREHFNTSAGIWRATRQVAVGLLGGQPTIAYFEHGTPEAFAAALAGSGVQDAVRLDSGSSASAYLTSGFGALGGYLNSVWGQKVPNAIVFVPKVGTTAVKGSK